MRAQRHPLSNALRTAADSYLKCAKVDSNLRGQFELQAREANALADEIDGSDSILLTD